MVNSHSRPVPFSVKKHWEQLRVDYVAATPRQRLGTIVDRLHDPLHWGPNLLVTGISAVEAVCTLSRCRSARESNEEVQSYRLRRGKGRQRG